MATTFLTRTEREKLERFPSDIFHDDLAVYFQLTEADLQFLTDRRGDHNRLGLALQLCALHFLGFVPDDLGRVPTHVMTYLAGQLGSRVESMDNYAERPQTRTDHLRAAVRHLNWHFADARTLADLGGWLAERALEHDAPKQLFRLALDWLRAQHVVRPGLDRLMRLVAAARVHAQNETYRRVQSILNDGLSAGLDALLETDDNLMAQIGSKRHKLRGIRTRHAWLAHGATSHRPADILEELDKIQFLRNLGVHQLDLSMLNPNRRKFLAQLGRKSSNKALQRLPPERRHPILLAFAAESLVTLTDEVADLFDRALGTASSKAKRKLNEWRLEQAVEANERLILFRELAGVLLDEEVADDSVRDVTFARVPRARLQAALSGSENLVRPLEDHHLDFLGKQAGGLREFTAALLDRLQFRSDREEHPLVLAVQALRRLNDESPRARHMPGDVPVTFVPAMWQPFVFQEGKVSRRFYELCVLYELRKALRSGDVWLEHARKYANPASFLIPVEQWPQMRAAIKQELNVEDLPITRIERLQQDILAEAQGLAQSLKTSNFIRWNEGRDGLILTPLDAVDLPPELAADRDRVVERMPRTELPDLMIEVDSWAEYTSPLTHAGNATSRSSDHRRNLYAAILAQACNFGPATFAEVTDLPYDTLAWTTEWYLREETLRSATAALVNYHHQLPLTRAWGGGTLSSSDGQRFPVRGRVANAMPLPRYFGLGRGITFYTWTSDQYSQYGTKVISVYERDAVHTLDEILNNETDLAIEEHTTDTAGATDLIFGLYDLLGLRYCPHLADATEQRLYRLEGQAAYGHVGSLLRTKISLELIVDHWDDILRVAGSLKRGWVTASLLISRLQASTRQSQSTLARALQEYGRLVKTRFLLRFFADREEQRRIRRQLNKGESLHELRTFLAFAKEGKLRRADPEAQLNQAGCLNLVTNAVIVWTTVYLQAVLDQLEREGTPVNSEVIKHFSPAMHAHINPYGRYRFDVEGGLARKELRPLRKPREVLH